MDRMMSILNDNATSSPQRRQRPRRKAVAAQPWNQAVVAAFPDRDAVLCVLGNLCGEILH
jgi:hypothetical protein